MAMNLVTEGNLGAAGEVIAQHRRASGMSLAEVSKATGLSRGHVSRIERGERAPSLGVLFKLARAYGVSLGTLVGEEAAEDSLGSVAGSTSSGDGVALRVVSTPDDPGTQQVILVDLKQGAATPISEHSGHEWVYVAEGAVALRVGSTARDLPRGSSAGFDASRPHTLRCAEGPARVILVTLTSTGRADSPDRHH